MVSMCRLCASLKKNEHLTFIRDNNHDLRLKLSKCCQLNINLKDILPKGVCTECIRSLNTSFEFYERVQESQQSLRQLLNIENDPPSPPTPPPPTAKASEVDDDPEAILKERTSQAMVAAAVATATDNTSPVEPESTKSENHDEVVNRVINEILSVKDEEIAYVVVEPEPEDDAQIEPLSEIEEEEELEGQDDTQTVILEASYAGQEYIEEDEIEIEYDLSKFEIIEDEVMEAELDDEEEADDPTYFEDQQQYEIQEIEENDEESKKPSTSLPVKSEPTDTWIEYPWKCVSCSEVFCSAKELIEHNLMGHFLVVPDMEWECADCLKTYSRYYMLVNHIRQRHRTHLALFCDVCNQTCESFVSLQEHRIREHAQDDQLIMLLCATCGKGFHNTNALQVHSKCHLPENQRSRFPCLLCDKKFRTASNLKFHQKMHTGARDFVCDQCGKNFRQKTNLEEHLLSHESSTPYECSICNKFFKTPDRLTKHKQRHSDDKPFTCTECGNGFRTKDSLATHMRIHTGEMPFRCEFCQKPFRFRSTLNTHHNVHTGVRPYSCLECDHHFTNWPNYNKHMKRRHDIDASSKNPRGKKPSNQPKPLKNPTKPIAKVEQNTCNVAVKLFEDEEDAEQLTGE